MQVLYSYLRRVKPLRIEKNLTQIQLAQKVGITQGYLSLAERGRSGDWGTVKKLYKALGVSLIDTIIADNNLQDFPQRKKLRELIDFLTR